jgi:hypothetical protein
MRKKDTKEATMKTFNIWKLVPEQVGPTGPWQFQSATLARNESEAIETAKMRHGLDAQYKVYEGF